ncbi:MAG TPA: hypothetical protein VGT99_09035 [Gammaproteobacteria bacterium]|nr:hypothetical protein [Gammaproteobacteria bacterium]
MNAMNLNKTLIRREFWENRSLWIVPAVTGGILTLVAAIATIKVMLGYASAGGDPHFALDNVPDLSAVDPGAVTAYIRFMTLFIWGIFDVVAQIVVFFYMLDSLYSDRRDRSILFWRSMPVSDERTVLAKLATTIIVSTAITFVAIVGSQLVLLVPQLVLGTYLNAHPWVLLEHPGDFLESWLIVAYILVVQTLWFLPYYGWQLLASAWAKRVPFLWAVLVPLGVMAAEGILLHSGRFARLVFSHALDWSYVAFDVNPENFFRRHGDADMAGSLVSFESFGHLLASAELWVGFVIAAAFVAGAIWLRRNRSEI